MAVIINGSINLNEIPKDKIIDGKKGKYLNITITVNDTVDQFGNQGPIVVSQSKEERESKAPKKYVGNGKVQWTDGTIIKAEFVERKDTQRNVNEPQNTSDKLGSGLPF